MSYLILKGSREQMQQITQLFGNLLTEFNKVELLTMTNDDYTTNTVNLFYSTISQHKNEGIFQMSSTSLSKKYYAYFKSTMNELTNIYIIRYLTNSRLRYNGNYQRIFL